MLSMFKDRLKDLRKKKGVTQTQVAKNIFVSRSLIAKFETGAAYPNKETLEKLALYFNVPVSYLIDKNENETKVSNDMKDISKKVNFVTLIFIIAITTIYSIIVFVPMFKGSRYIYPIPPGQEYFFSSILLGNYEHGNPIGLISFLLSFVLIVLSILCIFLRNKSFSIILRLITYILFVVDIFVCIASVICCLSYIS